MAKGAKDTPTHRRRSYPIVPALVWAAVLIVCFLHREQFTVDAVLADTPRNAVLAAVFMLLLFALKSLSVFIFSGILFAANGILFPLPQAIALNVLGAAVMVSLPYWLGRRMGGDVAGRLARRCPKLEMLRQARARHEFVFSFFTRVINILPSDLLSLYMGAAGIHYGKYLAGSLLGMLLSIVTFPIMGMSITDPGSPAFLVSVSLQAAAGAAALIAACRLQKKK